jgi:hypothetical protein
MNTKFSGGGILPIVKINDDLYFLTFGSKRGVLSDAGGKCDFGESIEKTCVREFYEESCKLFDISVSDISNHKFININAGRTFYRSYLPFFKFDISQNLFSKNRNILKSNKCSYQFLEKSEMILVPVNSKFERLNSNSTKIYTTQDISGQLRLVNRRLYKLIRDFQKSNINTEEIILEKKKLGGLVTYSK